MEFLIAFLVVLGIGYLYRRHSKTAVNTEIPGHGTDKKCPFCAETIKAEAIRCRYCQATLSPTSETKAPVAVSPPQPPQRTVSCPHCGKDIMAGATTCMHCWRKLA